jgi:hypothetical protein
MGRLTLASLVLLVGCTSPPPASSAPDGRGTTRAPIVPPAANTARLGVEFLAAAPRHAGTLIAGPDEVRVEPRERRVREPAPPAERERPEPAFDLSREGIARVDDTGERMTLRFLRELLGEDRLRVQREIGAPILNTHLRTYSSDMVDTAIDRAEREDQYSEVLRYQGRLVNRPLRKTLKELGIVRQVELAVDEFKAEHVPLSGAYQEARGSGGGWGRMSVRLKLSNLDDPVELAYLNDGVRVASRLELLKLGYDSWVTDELRLGFNTNYYYADGRCNVWAQMTYRVDPRTHVYCMMGDSMDLLTSTAMYPLITSPLELPAAESSLGILIYVEHLF